MSRQEELADAFDNAHEELLRFLAEEGEARWSLETDREGWPVGAVARHLAEGYALMSDWIESGRAGRPVELTRAELDDANATAAAAPLDETPEPTIERLQSGAREVSALIRSLTGADLGRTVPFGPGGGRQLSVERFCEIAEGHVREHLDSMLATVAPGE